MKEKLEKLKKGFLDSIELFKTEKEKEAVSKLEETALIFKEFEEEVIKKTEEDEKKEEEQKENLEKFASKDDLQDFKNSFDDLKKTLEDLSEDLGSRITKIEQYRESKQIKEDLTKTSKEDMFKGVLS